MAAAAALMVILARRLTGSGWAALFAGLIMALTPIVSYYAQTARSYALVYACVLGRRWPCCSALQAETAPGAARLRAVADLRGAGHGGRLPERDGAARARSARGHGAAGPVWPTSGRHWAAAAAGGAPGAAAPGA